MFFPSLLILSLYFLPCPRSSYSKMACFSLSFSFRVSFHFDNTHASPRLNLLLCYVSSSCFRRRSSFPVLWAQVPFLFDWPVVFLSLFILPSTFFMQYSPLVLYLTFPFVFWRWLVSIFCNSTLLLVMTVMTIHYYVHGWIGTQLASRDRAGVVRNILYDISQSNAFLESYFSFLPAYPTLAVGVNGGGVTASRTARPGLTSDYRGSLAPRRQKGKLNLTEEYATIITAVLQGSLPYECRSACPSKAHRFVCSPLSWRHAGQYGDESHPRPPTPFHRLPMAAPLNFGGASAPGVLLRLERSHRPDTRSARPAASRSDARIRYDTPWRQPPTSSVSPWAGHGHGTNINTTS